jgi:hypothetical protein
MQSLNNERHFTWRIKYLLEFYILLTVHLDVILVNDQLDALFLNGFISCLYMFRVNKCSSSRGPTCINTSSGITHSDRWMSDVPVKRPARQAVIHQCVWYQMMYWYKLVLLMMSTCCSKHVEEWNKYIDKECVKLIINQNYLLECISSSCRGFFLKFHI